MKKIIEAGSSFYVFESMLGKVNEFESILSEIKKAKAGGIDPFDPHQRYAVREKESGTPVAVMSAIPYLLEDELGPLGGLSLVIDLFELRRDLADSSLGAELLEAFANYLQSMYCGSTIYSVIQNVDCSNLLLASDLWKPAPNLMPLLNLGIVARYAKDRDRIGIAYPMQKTRGLFSFKAEPLRARAFKLAFGTILHDNSFADSGHVYSVEFKEMGLPAQTYDVGMEVRAFVSKLNQVCFEIYYGGGEADFREMRKAENYPAVIADAVEELARGYKNDRNAVSFCSPEKDVVGELQQRGWQLSFAYSVICPF